MDFNALIATFSSFVPSTSFVAQTIVSAFISAMFSSHSSKKSAIYEAKADFLNRLIYDLLQDNALTATEYLKCKNLSDIARLADEARARNTKRALDENTSDGKKATYDFDWFWRFFERAGYANDEDMKRLWASVLNEEIDHSGQFSYKAIETLFHMSKHEAELFGDMSQYSFVTQFGECILPSSDELYDNYDVTSPCVVDGESDLHAVLAAAYGITNEKVMLLDEYGLLSSMLTTSSFSITHDPICITNDCYAIEIRLKETCPLTSLEFNICGHRFSSVARQLFSVIENEPSLECLLDYARLIEHRHSEFDVKVFTIVSIGNEGLAIEDSVDWLHDPSCANKTKLHFLKDEDFSLA